MSEEEKLYTVTLSDEDVEALKNGDMTDVEAVVESLLHQVEEYKSTNP